MTGDLLKALINSLEKIEANKPKIQKKTSKNTYDGNEKENEEDIEQDQKHHRKAEELENVAKSEKIEDSKAARKQRATYALFTTIFMCIYISIVLVMLVYIGLEIMTLPAIPLAALISTIPASMALLAWVLKGLFSSK